jgi:hypothetical protein
LVWSLALGSAAILPLVGELGSVGPLALFPVPDPLPGAAIAPLEPIDPPAPIAPPAPEPCAPAIVAKANAAAKPASFIPVVIFMQLLLMLG